jgi:hypothetical protein
MRHFTLALLTISSTVFMHGLARAAEPFYAVSEVPALGTLFSITGEDYDEDGNLDVAVSCEYLSSYYMCFFWGDGTGFFPSFTSRYHNGFLPKTIGSSDFNLDTHMDVAVVNTMEHTLGAYLGEGNGSFSGYVTSPSPDYPSHFAVDRINSDQYDDIVAVSWVYGHVYSFLGTGHGFFDLVGEYDVGGGTTMIATADFFEDGDMDIVTSNMAYNDLVVMFGYGDGTFYGMKSIDVTYDAFAIATCDLNEDGHEDLVCGTKHTIATVLGDGLGGFTLNQVMDCPSPGVRALEPVDVNEDGHADIAASLVGSNKVRIYRGDGSGSLPTYRTVSSITRPYGITSGDFNGDGHVDLVVSSDETDTLTILINQWEVTSLNLIPPPNPNVWPGGSLSFDVIATNTQDTTVTTDVWLMGTRGTGKEFRIPPSIIDGPANPATVVLDPGEVEQLHYRIRIPGWAPAGYYKVMPRTGNYANDMMDESSFEGIILD